MASSNCSRSARNSINILVTSMFYSLQAPLQAFDCVLKTEQIVQSTQDHVIAVVTHFQADFKLLFCFQNNLVPRINEVASYG